MMLLAIFLWLLAISTIGLNVLLGPMQARQKIGARMKMNQDAVNVSGE
jgi:hypothetical protein